MVFDDQAQKELKLAKLSIKMTLSWATTGKDKIETGWNIHINNVLSSYHK